VLVGDVVTDEEKKMKTCDNEKYAKSMHNENSNTLATYNLFLLTYK
jgi:hypothetical protein